MLCKFSILPEIHLLRWKTPVQYNLLLCHFIVTHPATLHSGYNIFISLDIDCEKVITIFHVMQLEFLTIPRTRYNSLTTTTTAQQSESNGEVWCLLLVDCLLACQSQLALGVLIFIEAKMKFFEVKMKFFEVKMKELIVLWSEKVDIEYCIQSLYNRVVTFTSIMTTVHLTVYCTKQW